MLPTDVQRLIYDWYKKRSKSFLFRSKQPIKVSLLKSNNP